MFFKCLIKKKLHISLLAMVVLVGCTKNENRSGNEPKEILGEAEMIIDSLLYFRHQAEKTDLLSRRLPELTREEAISVQLAMLKKELDSGARHIGWKMAGTVIDDSTDYDPLFGYILDSNIIKEDSTVSAKNFPGERAMVEGEIGFVINKDLKNGANSIEELKEAIDYVIGAVEFAQDIAIPVEGKPATKSINHTLAAGMGHAGIILGSEKVKIEEFNMDTETVKCFINNKLIAEGISSRIYGGPLNALYSLVNLLTEYDSYIKKGDVVITGSLYDNPTIDSTSEVRLEFKSLGVISFSMK